MLLFNKFNQFYLIKYVFVRSNFFYKNIKLDEASDVLSFFGLKAENILNIFLIFWLKTKKFESLVMFL